MTKKKTAQKETKSTKNTAKPSLASSPMLGHVPTAARTAKKPSEDNTPVNMTVRLTDKDRKNEFLALLAEVSADIVAKQVGRDDTTNVNRLTWVLTMPPAVFERCRNAVLAKSWVNYAFKTPERKPA